MKKLIYSQEDLDLVLSLETEEKDKEIERLNKENKILRENAEHNDKVVDKVNWENKRLNNIINEFDNWLLGEQMMFYRGSDNERLIRFGETKNKWLELKDINEPSFEEMVNFVENIYQDIKNQSTLDEELKGERERIAKIVGNFKEVNK